MELSSYIFDRLKKIDECLSSVIEEKKSQPHASLFEAARYSLLSRAKRLRPLLAIATAESFGASFELALLPACALEVLHTYSLIHDDLPCMDDDDLRRGRPTLHKVYGDGHAVLTGDFLLTFAFEILSMSPGLDAEQKIELVSVLAKRAGADGMVGGQVVDLICEGKQTDWQTLQFIHKHKTAALFAAAFEFGAIIAKASCEDRSKLKLIGEEIGLSFQIIDDILDETSTESELGKPIRSDLTNDKSTAISVLGLEKAKDLSHELLASAQARCSTLSVPAQLLQDLIHSTAHRKF